MNFLKALWEIVCFSLTNRNDSMTQIINPPEPPPTPPVPPLQPSSPDILIPDWSAPKNAYHNVRVLCDLAGLTLEEKNIICACIYQESEFNINAVNHNTVNGKILSTDYSICQINDWYHIGVGKDFPSVQYVLANPDKAVEWMIGMYHHGLLKQWVSYSSGAYKRWLLPNSPMSSL
jgi:hypothetical protein